MASRGGTAVKPSHERTPRTISDAVFTVGYPTIERHTRPVKLSLIVFWTLLFSGAAFVLGLLWNA